MSEKNKEEAFLEKLAESFRFFGRLSDDADEAKSLLIRNDTQFSRRTYIRSLFAFIEGNSYRLRQMALAAHYHRSNCFTNEEILILEEKEVSVDGGGNIKVRARHLDFISGLRFSQKCFNKAIGGKVSDYGDSGWEKLRIAVTIRNRITHPKNEDDLKIKDEELAVIDDAKKWYSDNVQFLL